MGSSLGMPAGGCGSLGLGISGIEKKTSSFENDEGEAGSRFEAALMASTQSFASSYTSDINSWMPFFAVLTLITQQEGFEAVGVWVKIISFEFVESSGTFPSALKLDLSAC